MKITEVEPGFVFEMLGEYNGEHDLYVILDVVDHMTFLEIRWLYLSGRDAGSSYRTLLRHDDGWSDTRVM